MIHDNENIIKQKVNGWEHVELLDEFGINEALQKLETLTNNKYGLKDEIEFDNDKFNTNRRHTGLHTDI